MNRRFRRHPAWPSVHERARSRAAERLDGPIDREEAKWVDLHLEACPDCRGVVADYEAQRLALRIHRNRMPDPPRDLWARTAAAIERESNRAGVGRDTAVPRAARRSARPAAAPLGALSALLVVVVVVGATLLSQRSIPGPAGTSNPTEVAVASPRVTFPGATPFAVAAGNVDWLRLGGDNQIEIFDSQVQRVCPERQGADCPPIAEPSPKSLRLPGSPSSVVKSPNDDEIVVRAGNGVYVVPGNGVTASASPIASPTPSTAPTPVEPSVTPSASPTTPASSAPASASPTPSISATASTAPSPSATPVDLPTPTVAPTPSVTALATLGPTASPTPIQTASATPETTPASPSAPPGTQQIANDVIVVGEAAAYSPDGAWFAFSARPEDESQGPDIYTWHVGDAKARPVTTDHASVFASWRGSQIVASRAVAGSAPRSLVPQSFVLDPVSGKETALASAAVWRPSVHPHGRLAVYWDGTLSTDAANADLRPGDGRLVVGPWSDSLATVAPSGSPNQSPSLSTPDGSRLATTQLATGKVSDWDARWDETGTRLAVWVADGSDAKIGKLTLFSVDPETGVVRAEKALHDVRALAGFSIGKGRLAWATPRGQDAKGSRVQVVAWTKDAVGSIESQGTDSEVVIIR